MGIETHRIEPHWNYLLALESDLVVLSRYVEFHERNFDCFSIEIARILLAASAEVDVVAKQLCRVVDATSSADNIIGYRDVIRPSLPAISDFEVLVPRFGLTLRPWDEWKNKDGVPFWWTAYNKVKHQRDTHYEGASLKNALNAVTGLFVLVLHLYRDEARMGHLAPIPQLLRVGDRHHGGEILASHDSGLCYDLDEPKVVSGGPTEEAKG